MQQKAQQRLAFHKNAHQPFHPSPNLQTSKPPRTNDKVIHQSSDPITKPTRFGGPTCSHHIAPGGSLYFSSFFLSLLAISVALSSQAKNARGQANIF
jgi:hypothetical protein